jgi:pimeloyl-ACP methyl ester carboxylesterase
MAMIELATQRLHYRDEGRGPAAVLLHANPGDGRDFDAIMPALSQRFRVLRPDWPGYGGSPAAQPVERSSPPYYAEVLDEFLDALQIERTHLVGNSIGGNAAVRYALKRPDRVASLVLVSPGGFTAHNPATRLFCRLMGNPRINRALRGPFSRACYPVRTPWSRALIERALGEHATPAATAVNAANWRAFLQPEHDLRITARALRVPTLIINGRRDRIIPPQRDGRCAATAIPGARLLIPDCGHAPFAELPPWFLDAVGDFWEAPDPTTPATMTSPRTSHGTG